MGQKGSDIVELDLQGLIDDLNRAYCDEWLAYYSYRYMARQVSGPMYREMAELLEKAAKLELEHAEELTRRINELGGTPLDNPMDLDAKSNHPYPKPPEAEDDYNAILMAVKHSEAQAIGTYNDLAKKTFGKDHVTYALVCHILAEEVAHEEMFEAFRRQKVKEGIAAGV